MFQISEYEVDSFITIIQVKLSCFLCCLISLTFVAGVGRGASCPGFILPPTWVLCLILFNVHFTCFKLSVHEVESFYNHNASQIELFSLLFGLIPLVAGVGGKLSRAVYLAPHLGIMFNFFNAHFTCFKLSVHEVVSYIIIIQVKLSCFLCRLVSYP